MRKHVLPVISLICCFFMLALPNTLLLAQTEAVQVSQPAQVNQSGQQVSTAQLASLVSPIALYPDPLLSQVLVAATYPLEIVEAAQWLHQNQGLTGKDLQSAASKQNWDPSIQALVVFPDVLERMDGDIKWTTDLGNAFLAQQAGVMDAVQQLRSEAMASGKLSSNPQDTVTTQQEGDSSAIEIMPTNPEVIYVPQYDPFDIWGPSFYPYPYGFGFGGFGYGAGLIGFGAGCYVGGFFGGWGGWGGWGWHPNWFGRSVMVNNGFFSRYGYRGGFAGGAGRMAGASTWTHDPVHRAGVPYANRAVASQFHSTARAPSAGGMQSSARSSGMSFAHPNSQMSGSRMSPQVNGSRMSPQMNGSRMTPQRPGTANTFAQRPTARSYQAPQVQRSSPSQGAVSRSAPMPSYRSSPSFSSGGGRSFGGGGGGRSSGGGGGRSGGGRPR